ncbi:hypothetical protein GDO81_029113 [Engystomops pustulosus]|uniref:Uncharacterized protein n=1 Tax=Engystomops pustulosus TaxID=76066 RepID=A0AAV6YDF5_ENGPU|nr:hypothetical protein GDO81_029113 [Engystomops pustulosus]
MSANLSSFNNFSLNGPPFSLIKVFLIRSFSMSDFSLLISPVISDLCFPIAVFTLARAHRSSSRSLLMVLVASSYSQRWLWTREA